MKLRRGKITFFHFSGLVEKGTCTVSENDSVLSTITLSKEDWDCYYKVDITRTGVHGSLIGFDYSNDVTINCTQLTEDIIVGVWREKETVTFHIELAE